MVHILDGYVKNRQTDEEDENKALVDYMYQTIMRDGTTEYAI